jgi:hypothetical protein
LGNRLEVKIKGCVVGMPFGKDSIAETVNKLVEML